MGCHVATPSKFTRRIGASGLLTSTDRSSLGRQFAGEAPLVSKTRREMAHEIEPRVEFVARISNVTIFADAPALRLGISVMENV
jgi:hypothetical protein